MKYAYSLLAIFLFSGCASPSIHARSIYSTPRNRASIIIDTPDPEKEKLGLTQHLWIHWYTPELDSSTCLQIHAQYHDGSEKQTVYPITSHIGECQFVVGPKKKLQSYLVKLVHHNNTIAQSTHKLFVEKIILPEDES